MVARIKDKNDLDGKKLCKYSFIITRCCCYCCCLGGVIVIIGAVVLLVLLLLLCCCSCCYWCYCDVVIVVIVAVVVVLFYFLRCASRMFYVVDALKARTSYRMGSGLRMLFFQTQKEKVQ